MMMTRPSLPLLLSLTLSISTCAQSVDISASQPPPPAPVPPTVSELATASTITTDGKIEFVSNNDIRYLPSPTDLISATQIDIPLAGKPLWVAGIPHAGGSIWTVALEDGSLQAFIVNSNGYTTIPVSPEKLPPGVSLTIYSRDGKVYALIAPGTDTSPLTAPLLLGQHLSGIAYIATDGDLVIWQNGQETRLPVDALPDSRILSDGQGRLLLLSNPTDRYAHGVLGDELEAAAITLIETTPEPRISNRISIPEPAVIEGVSPIWADINNDGELEIIVTLSNAQNGARIVAYKQDGSLLAEGPAIGTGFRWRHQLVVAPFGSSGEKLLAVVRTPHIGGVVEFYRLNGDKLEITTEIPGFSTHSIGSRNLFTAQAGDFDNDGQIELLAPDQSHARLGIVGVDNDPVLWLSLGAKLLTNLASVTLTDSESFALAAGLSNNSLRVWLP